jgi:hypothetical protein
MSVAVGTAGFQGLGGFAWQKTWVSRCSRWFQSGWRLSSISQGRVVVCIGPGILREGSGRALAQCVPLEAILQGATCTESKHACFYVRRTSVPGTFVHGGVVGLPLTSPSGADAGILQMKHGWAIPICHRSRVLLRSPPSRTSAPQCCRIVCTFEEMGALILQRCRSHAVILMTFHHTPSRSRTSESFGIFFSEAF